MKKLVLKTVAITMASIIALLLFTCGIFAIFFPSVIAKTADNLGWGNTAVKYYEKQYDKTEDIEDLYTLCFASFNNGDYERAKFYFATLNSSQPQFNVLCEIKDLERESVIKTKEICIGALIRSFYEVDGYAVAVTKSCNYVVSNAYTEYSPFLFLLESYGEDLTTSELNLMKDKIRALINGQEGAGLSSEETAFAQKDITEINRLLELLTE